MSEGGGDELLSLLDRRSDVLSMLADRPYEKRELVDRLDVSRSTVNRAVRELEVEGCVTRTEDGYVATLPGRLAVESHRTHRRELDAIDRTTDLLARLPRDVSLPPDLLVDATVHHSEPPLPNGPAERLKGFVERGDAIRSLTVTELEADCTETLRDRTLSGDLDAEYVVSTTLADHLRKRRGGVLREPIRDGTLTVYEHPDVEFGLKVVDLPDRRLAAVGAHYDDARLAGLLVDDSEDAVTWAQSLYEDYRREATEVDLS